jgi:hypothetical protein
LCPSPWRVPSSDDFHSLLGSATQSDLISAWGYIQNDNDYPDEWYWSITESQENRFAMRLRYTQTSADVISSHLSEPHTVRCVR